MASLSSLNFILKADISQFQTALRNASNQMQKTGSALKSAGEGMSKYLTAPIVAAGAAMVIVSSRSAEFADSIDEMSQRTGVAKTTLQELNYVAGQIGIDFPNMEKSMAKLNKSMGDAAGGGKIQSEAFAKLGISVTDSSGQLRSMSAIFPEVIGALSGMSNETERNYLSMQLFGKGANQVITPLTVLGKEGMQSMIDKAHELGVVMGDEGITSLANYNDAMQSMKDQVAAAGREMSVGFAKIMTETILPLLQEKIIPAIVSLAKWFSDLPSGIKTSILAFAGLVAAIGPLLFMIGGLMTIIPKVIAGAKMLSGAMTLLNAVMAANPIGAVIVAVAALVAIVIWAWNKFEGFRMFILGLWGSFKAVFSNIGELAKNVLGGIGEMLVGVFTFDLEKIRGGLDRLKSGFSEFGSSVAEGYRTGAEAGRDMNDVVAETDGEVKKLTDTTSKAVPVIKSLEEQISSLEGQLWQEVQANDANATSTARVLQAKQAELQYLKDKQDLLLKINRMESIQPTKEKPLQVSADASVGVGPASGDVMFTRQTEQLSGFSAALKETAKVAIDVSDVVRGAISDMATLAGQSLGKLMAGTFDIQDLLSGFLGIIADFCSKLGAMMIAVGTAGIVLKTLGTISPWVALAAGIALVALGALASSFMSKGPSMSGSGSSGPSNSGSYNIPGAASGGIVSRPTILMAGEGGESEAILPIGNLMRNIYNAVAYRSVDLSGNSSGGGLQPVTVTGRIEGRIKAGDLYLTSKVYNEKLKALK